MSRNVINLSRFSVSDIGPSLVCKRAVYKQCISKYDYSQAASP